MKTLHRRMESYFVLEPGLLLKIAWGKSAIDLRYVKKHPVNHDPKVTSPMGQKCYG